MPLEEEIALTQQVLQPLIIKVRFGNSLSLEHFFFLPWGDDGY